jgi:hypothetical protein
MSSNEIDVNRLDSGLEGSLTEIDGVHQKLRALTHNLVRSVCLKHLDFGPEQLEAQEALVTGLLASFGYAREVVQIRQRNRANVLDHLDYTLVSLGYDCFPRTISTKMGLMPSRADGTLTCPFDLCVHPLNAVTELLRDDFAAYGEEGAYTLNAKGLAVHRRLSITFNHDRGESLFQNNFLGLRDFYARRARNFREYSSRDNAIFLLNLARRDHANFSQFHSVFRSRFPTKPLLVICEVPLEEIGTDTDLHLYQIPAIAPCGEYRWYAAEDFATERGKAFEFPIAEGIVEVLSKVCPLKV